MKLVKIDKIDRNNEDLNLARKTKPRFGLKIAKIPDVTRRHTRPRRTDGRMDAPAKHFASHDREK